MARRGPGAGQGLGGGLGEQEVGREEAPLGLGILGDDHFNPLTTLRMK